MFHQCITWSEYEWNLIDSGNIHHNRSFRQRRKLCSKTGFFGAAGGGLLSCRQPDRWHTGCFTLGEEPPHASTHYSAFEQSAVLGQEGEDRRPDFGDVHCPLLIFPFFGAIAASPAAGVAATALLWVAFCPSGLIPKM